MSPPTRPHLPPRSIPPRRIVRNIALRRAVLGWQVRQGRVRRVARGRYLAVAEAIARTTRWRIEHGDDLD